MNLKETPAGNNIEKLNLLTKDFQANKNYLSRFAASILRNLPEEKLVAAFDGLGYKNIKEITEDVLSETFEIALRSIDKFRGDSPIKYWLASIIKNIIRMKLRQIPVNKKNINIEEYVENMENKGNKKSFFDQPENLLIRGITFKKIMNLIKEADFLSKKEKNIISLMCEGGLKTKEVAEKLNIPEETVRVAILRIKKKLEKKLSTKNKK